MRMAPVSPKASSPIRDRLRVPVHSKYIPRQILVLQSIREIQSCGTCKIILPYVEFVDAKQPLWDLITFIINILKVANLPAELSRLQ